MQPGPQPGEIVHRPDPGLARGKWEAPSWAFLAIAVGAVVVTILYVLARTGKLPLTRRAAAAAAGTKHGDRNRDRDVNQGGAP